MPGIDHLDSLRGIAYADDKQIVEIHAYRRDDPANPRIEVVIESAPDPNPRTLRTPRARRSRVPR